MPTHRTHGIGLLNRWFALVALVFWITLGDSMARLSTPGEDTSELAFFEECPLIVAGRFVALAETGEKGDASREHNAYVFEIDHVIKGEIRRERVFVNIPDYVLRLGMTAIKTEYFPSMKRRGRYLLMLEMEPDQSQAYTRYGLRKTKWYCAEFPLGKTQAPEARLPDWRSRLEQELQQSVALAPDVGEFNEDEAVAVLFSIQLLQDLNYDPEFLDIHMPSTLTSEHKLVRRAARLWVEKRQRGDTKLARVPYSETEMVRLFGEPIDRCLVENPAPILPEDPPWQSHGSDQVQAGQDSPATRVLIWNGIHISYFEFAKHLADSLADTTAWDWDQQDGDIQVSIRMSKNRYSFQEPVYVLIAVRNASTNTLDVLHSRPENLFEIVMTGEDSQLVPPTRYGARLSVRPREKMKAMSTITEPGQALGYVLELSEMRDLTLCGTYFVQLRALPLDMSSQSDTSMLSNRVSFEMQEGRHPSVPRGS